MRNWTNQLFPCWLTSSGLRQALSWGAFPSLSNTSCKAHHPLWAPSLRLHQQEETSITSCGLCQGKQERCREGRRCGSGEAALLPQLASASPPRAAAHLLLGGDAGTLWGSLGNGTWLCCLTGKETRGKEENAQDRRCPEGRKPNSFSCTPLSPLPEAGSN